MRSIAVYPGSFDPLTNGHLDILERALNHFEQVVLAVAVNSTKTSLFPIQERVTLIREATKGLKNLKVETFQGLLVDYCRENGIKVIIRGLRAVTDFDYECAISLMNKKLSPEIETIFLMASSEFSFVSSSIVKEVASHGGSIKDQVPEVIYNALTKKFKNKENKK